jgi:hypothetical protein
MEHPEDRSTVHLGEVRKPGEEEPEDSDARVDSAGHERELLA